MSELAEYTILCFCSMAVMGVLAFLLPIDTTGHVGDMRVVGRIVFVVAQMALMFLNWTMFAFVLWWTK